jgi:hypothetical protein
MALVDMNVGRLGHKRGFVAENRDTENPYLGFQPRCYSNPQIAHQAKSIPAAGLTPFASAPDPVLGAMRDAADELDDVVPESMKHREQQPWRLSPGE